MLYCASSHKYSRILGQALYCTFYNCKKYFAFSTSPLDWAATAAVVVVLSGWFLPWVAARDNSIEFWFPGEGFSWVLNGILLLLESDLLSVKQAKNKNHKERECNLNVIWHFHLQLNITDEIWLLFFFCIYSVTYLMVVAERLFSTTWHLYINGIIWTKFTHIHDFMPPGRLIIFHFYKLLSFLNY